MAGSTVAVGLTQTLVGVGVGVSVPAGVAVGSMVAVGGMGLDVGLAGTAVAGVVGWGTAVPAVPFPSLTTSAGALAVCPQPTRTAKINKAPKMYAAFISFC